MSKPESVSGSGSPAWMLCCAALRGDVDGRVGGAAAEVVFAIGADAEVGGVAIEADFAAGLEGVTAGGEGEVLLRLEEVAVDAA